MSENLQATKKLTSAAKERDSLQAQLKASQTKNEQIFKLNSENTTITTQLKAKVALLEGLCRTLQQENDALVAKNSSAPDDEV